MPKPQSKLLLISGTGDSPKLADDIYKELRDTYQMGNSVEILIPKKPTEIEKGVIKSHTHPLVVGSFSDSETRVDIGRNELLDAIRGKHIAIIKYMYTPKRYPNMHINDHFMEVIGMLDVFKATDTLRRTLVAPYLPYLRSHSIEKYERQGFYQFDSLDTMVEFYSKKGLNGIICIDPHSDKIIEKAKEYNITVNSIDPFQSNNFINPYKLGLNSTSEEILSKLQPFREYFNKIRNNKNKFIFISLDDGTERRTEQFLINCGLRWDKIIYMGKSRQTIETSTSSIKSFSRINEDNLDKDAIYIMVDDMVSSGGSAEKVAKTLKERGIKEVKLLCSHAVAPVREKIENLEYLDEIIALDTILHNNPKKMKLSYLNISAYLLAAEIYKIHMKLEEDRLKI